MTDINKVPNRLNLEWNKAAKDGVIDKEEFNNLKKEAESLQTFRDIAIINTAIHNYNNGGEKDIDIKPLLEESAEISKFINNLDHEITNAPNFEKKVKKGTAHGTFEFID